MQELLTPNELFREYSQKKIEKRQFEELLLKVLIQNYDRYHLYHWQRDEYMDYLNWLYPRFTRAIDHYRDTGSTFEAYINTMIRWSAKEYRSRQMNHRIIEQAAWTTMAADMPREEQMCQITQARAEKRQALRSGSVMPLSGMSVCSDRPDYPGILIPPAKFVNPRQVLILVLKSYFFVSDDFLDRIAPFISMEKEKLKALVDRLRTVRLKRDDGIRGLQERICCQFYRCITYEHRLLRASENSALYFTIKNRLIRARRRLSGMRARLARIRLEATNLQVAEVLGIPKGTIDSNLHALRYGMDARKKRPFSGCYDTEMLNYN
jgi:hypothetical protein